MTFAERVKELRTKLDLTQELFAAKLGLAKSYISNVEKGERILSTEKIQKIVEEYNVDARWFFGQIDDIDDAFVEKTSEATTENLLSRLTAIESKVMTPDPGDETLHRVAITPNLREIVELIQFQDATKLREMRALIYGYLYRDQEKGEVAERRRA